MKFMNVENATEGTIVDLSPLIETLGFTVSPYDATNYEYAVVEGVELKGTSVILYTNQHNLDVPVGTILEIPEWDAEKTV